MAGNKASKLILLFVYKILIEETDEQHPMTPQQLIERLEEYGYDCERKSIYRHIEALTEFGLDVLRSDREPRGYYVVSRDFELTELRLLIDAVQSSHFISHKKSAKLIDKLVSLASVHEAQQIKKGLHMRLVNKTDNEKVYYILDSIYKAIATNRRLEFKYFEYTPSKQKRYRGDGKPYLVSPFAVVWDDEKYYMHAYHEKYDAISSFRVDLMEDARLSEHTRLKTDEYAAYDPGERSKTSFDQFGGEQITVVAEFDNRLAGAVIDRFGTEVTMYPVDDTKFAAHFKVEASIHFFAWLFGFGDKVRVKSPQSLVDAYAAQLNTVRGMYDE